MTKAKAASLAAKQITGLKKLDMTDAELQSRLPALTIPMVPVVMPDGTVWERGDDYGSKTAANSSSQASNI